jgi:hypothetical protein
MKAWHFTNDKLRDGKPVPAIGEKLVHKGDLVLCESGLLASKRIIDALHYASGHMIHRVECGGEIIHGEDELVCTERTILFTVNGERLLRRFARMCGLDVIHLWDAGWDAAWTAQAAWGAAWDAAGRNVGGAWDAQNKRLYRMVMRARRNQNEKTYY